MTRNRRNRLVHLLALALAATAVPLALPAPPAGAAASRCTRTSSPQVNWTGAAGDGSWDDAANWDVVGGGHRVPTSTDDACVDPATTGGAHAPGGIDVASLEVEGGPTEAALELSGEVAVTSAIFGTGAVQLTGTTHLGSFHLEPGSVLVDAGAAVTSDAEWRGQHFDDIEIGPVRVAGTLHLRGSAYFSDLQVDAGGRVDTAFTQLEDVRFGDDLDIRPGGAVAVGAHALVATAPSARLLGEAPSLDDVEIDHRAPFSLTVRGDVVVHNVDAGATLLVRPDGDQLSLTERPVGSGSSNRGTLDIAGPTGALGPRAEVRVPFVNHGTLRVDRVTFEQGLDNRGTTEVGQSVWVASANGLANSGQLVVGPRGPAAGPLSANLLVVGPLANSGSITATDPTAEVSATGYSGTGSIAPWLGVFNEGPSLGLHAAAGPATVVPVLTVGQTQVALPLGGLADASSGRVVVTKALIDLGDVVSLQADVGSGFVPCAGSRWQLVSWPKLLKGWRVPSANPSGDVQGPSDAPGGRADVVRQAPTLSASGLPSGVTLSLRERADGWVAVASGAPTGGAACTDPVGRRLVSGWFVDGNGRPATAAELARLGDRAATTAGRVAVARELLRTPAATDRFVAGELRRILGRPGSAANVAAYSARVQAGTATPDMIRAEVYGDSAFWAASGKTVDGWAKAFYRSELGRVPTAAELGVVRGQLAPGHLTRRVVAQYLLAGAEFDRALAGRSISLWWDRPSTAAERSLWATRYAAGAELRVTADLAAADPIS